MDLVVGESGIVQIIIPKMAGIPEDMVENHDDDKDQQNGRCLQPGFLHASKLRFTLKKVYKMERVVYFLYKTFIFVFIDYKNESHSR